MMNLFDNTIAMRVEKETVGKPSNWNEDIVRLAVLDPLVRENLLLLSLGEEQTLYLMIRLLSSIRVLNGDDKIHSFGDLGLYFYNENRYKNPKYYNILGNKLLSTLRVLLIKSMNIPALSLFNLRRYC
ncbi:hypothetical protein [Peribacillus sp. NPDC058002]|uniref:hypothetical protein n=1 Tax=Peribacillus sp. NPDC058002 TaxID=3346301 RepID=UPI0036DFA046